MTKSAPFGNVTGLPSAKAMNISEMPEWLQGMFESLLNMLGDPLRTLLGALRRIAKREDPREWTAARSPAGSPFQIATREVGASSAALSPSS